MAWRARIPSVAGDPKVFPLEARIFNAATFIALVVAVTALPIAFALAFPVVTQVATGVCAVLNGVLFYASRWGRPRTWLGPTFVGVNLVVASVLWLQAGGLRGSMPYLYFPMVFLMLAILPGPQRRWGFAAIIMDIAGLVAVEQVMPSWVVAYPDEATHYLDLCAALAQSLVASAYGISVLKRNYDEDKVSLEQERDKTDALLLNILPRHTADELKETGAATPQHYERVTVLFTDFKGFTGIAEKLSPSELVAQLNTCFTAFDDICQRHHLERIKTIGDAYMAAGGVPVPNLTNPQDAVAAALEIQEFMAAFNREKDTTQQPTWAVRIGVHTGSVVAGVVGKRKFAYDIWGDAVNVASRMESSGEVDRVNISGDTHALVKDRFDCAHRGRIHAKNKGEVDMYFVTRKSRPVT